jgi:hypothetical protein
MGVSVFPGRDSLVPNVERVARDACARLAQATPESAHERLRDVLSRLVEELILEGGLLFLPLESEVGSVAVGSLPASKRALSEFLGRSRLQSGSTHSEVMVVADPPHGATRASCRLTITFICGRSVFARW